MIRTISKRVLLILAILSSCGPNTNPNKLAFVRAKDKKRADTLLALGQLAYDKGDFEKAVSYGRELYEFNPKSERAAQLLAFSRLGEAGVSVFNIARKLAKSVTTESATSLAILDQIGAIFGVNDDIISMMATSDGLDTDKSTSKYFAGLPVYLPKLPGNSKDMASVRASVPILAALSEAIMIICPFVDESLVKGAYSKSGDERYNCAKNDTYQEVKAQSYVAWAMAHIVETAVFDLVLLYTPSSTSLHLAAKSKASGSSAQLDNNLIKRVAKLQEETSSSNLKLADIGSYTAAVVKLKESFDAVFDVTDKSMLSQAIADLYLVADGFKLIPGMPADVTNAIDSALSDIEKTAAAIKQVGDVQATTQAFAQELNSTIAKNLSKASSTYLDSLVTKVGGISALQDKIDSDASARSGLKSMCESMTGLKKTASTLTVPEQCGELDFS